MQKEQNTVGTMQDGGGLRYNDGKPRYDLITPFALEELAKVLTKGAEKYAPHNWQRGLSWSSVLASMQRHIEAFKKGEDYDKETGLLHIGHVLCNAMFLAEYYNIYPQGDDRQVSYLTPKRIGLDIDDVIADTITRIMEYKGWTKRPASWNDPRFSEELFSQLAVDKGFWMSIEPLVSDLPFDPCCYVTSRSIPEEWTKEWLDKHLFPAAPVISTHGQSKVDVLKKLNVDIFVEDNYHNFVEINQAGIFCYLFSRTHNDQYEVGHRRIRTLHDFGDKRTSFNIEEILNEIIKK